MRRFRLYKLYKSPDESQPSVFKGTMQALGFPTTWGEAKHRIKMAFDSEYREKYTHSHSRPAGGEM